MRQFILTGLYSGLRSRSVQAVFLLGILLVATAYLAASFSPRHPRTVAMDVGFSGGRFSLVLFALLWVQELFGREIDRRTLLVTLSYPVSRSALLLGRYLSILALLLLATLLLGLMLQVAVLFAGGAYQQQFAVNLGLPYWSTWLGLWLDAAVVAAVSLLLATLATVPMLPIVVGLAFAVAGKSLGVVLDYLRQGADGDVHLVATFGPWVDAMQWVLPDLSRLDWRLWPMYNLEPGIGVAASAGAMAIGYVAMTLALASLLFARREF